MALVNEHFLKLPGSYLFSDIAKKVNTFKITHPKQDIIRLGIGDVTQPLPKACIEAMHKAVEWSVSSGDFPIPFFAGLCCSVSYLLPSFFCP